MTKRMETAFDGLRAAIFEMYAALEERGSGPGTEHERRERAAEHRRNPRMATVGLVLGEAARIARTFVRVLARGRSRGRGSSSVARPDPMM